MSSLCVKFQPSSTPPSDRFWWGVLVVLVVLLVLLLLVLLVKGVKQSQLLVLRLSLEFDNISLNGILFVMVSMNDRNKATLVFLVLVCCMDHSNFLTEICEILVCN